MNVFKIWTDGSARPNPGPGGWGVYIEEPENNTIITWNFFDGEIHTTNNRMELTAIIKGISWLIKTNKGRKVIHATIYTDSNYCKNSIGNIVNIDGQPHFDGWINGWVKKGWKNSSGSVINKDLWIKLYQVVQNVCQLGINIKIEKVKAHSKIYGNERADFLANSGTNLVISRIKNSYLKK